MLLDLSLSPCFIDELRLERIEDESDGTLNGDANSVADVGEDNVCGCWVEVVCSTGDNNDSGCSIFGGVTYQLKNKFIYSFFLLCTFLCTFFICEISSLTKLY